MATIKTFGKFALISNILVFLMVIIPVLLSLFTTSSGNVEFRGFEVLRYFTVQSNLLAAFACAAMIPFNIKAIRSGSYSTPRGLQRFKFVGTQAVTVTFLTVMLFLGPSFGYLAMFAGTNLLLHLICPLLALLTFCILEPCDLTRKEAACFGILPTLLYGILYMSMVIFVGKDNGGWEDFYGFNIGGYWYISFFVMLLFSFGLCLGLVKLNALASRWRQ